MNKEETTTNIKPEKTIDAVTKGGSAFSRYKKVIVGHTSFAKFAYYEFCMVLSLVPGALGFLLRKVFWPSMFGSCGKGVEFAPNITLRHPHRIHLGNRVVISNDCVIDARSEDTERAITLGDDIVLSNGVVLKTKNSRIVIGARSSFGTHTIIHSTNNCPVSIGEDVMTGPHCYLVGGGSYNTDRFDIPMCRQGIRADGGLTLENDIWLGANVSVLGGVTMETGSIAAAGAVVNKSVPPYAICGGVPMKVIKTRKPL